MADRFLEIALGNAGSAVLLALAVMLVTRIVRRPAVAHLLWTVVLLRLLMPPLLELPLLPTADPLRGAAVVEGVFALPVGGAAAAVEGRVAGAPVKSLGLLAWALGAALVAAVAAVRTTRLSRLVAASSSPSPALERRMSDLAERMGLARPPRTRVVDAPVSPMLWAPFRAPTLVLPKALLDRLEGREHDTLIAHELAHLRRRDHLVRYLELVATVAFWWHPLVWWASRQLRAAEEQCCDALVATSLPGHVRAYADCLVKTLRYVSLTGLRPQPVASGLGEMKHLKGRITMIMSRRVPQSVSASVRGLVLLLSLAALVMSPTLACRSDEPAAVEYSGDPITLNLSDAELRDVLLVFSELVGPKIAVDTRAEEAGLLDAKVTLEVSETPWDEALDRILHEHGLGATLEGETLWVHAVGDAMEVGDPFNGEPLLRLPEPDLAPVSKTADGSEPFTYVKDGKITEPRKLETPRPVYPEHLRKEKVQGVVILETVVTVEGLVSDVKVLNDAHPDFAQAAKEAVRQWTFEPATLDGDPVAVKYILTAQFRLK